RRRRRNGGGPGARARPDRSHRRAGGLPPPPLRPRRPAAPPGSAGRSGGRLSASARARSATGGAHLSGATAGRSTIVRVTMTAQLRRVLLRPPGGSDGWERCGWRGEPDPVAIAHEHESLCASRERAGAEGALAGPPEGAPDAMHLVDPLLGAPGGG